MPFNKISKRSFTFTSMDVTSVVYTTKRFNTSIGVNNLGGSFEKSPNVVQTKIQNFIEIQSSRFW